MVGGLAVIMESMLSGSRWIAKLAQLCRTDGRRHLRLRAEFAGTIAGPFGAIHVTGADLNRRGAGVRSEEALPEGALVFLRISDLGAMGFAHVRHCSRRGDGYFLGLEFREGLSRERNDLDDWSYQRLARSSHRAWDEAAY